MGSQKQAIFPPIFSNKYDKSLGIYLYKKIIHFTYAMYFRNSDFDSIIYLELRIMIIEFKS